MRTISDRRRKHWLTRIGAVLVALTALGLGTGTAHAQEVIVTGGFFCTPVGEDKLQFILNYGTGFAGGTLGVPGSGIEINGSLPGNTCPDVVELAGPRCTPLPSVSFDEFLCAGPATQVMRALVDLSRSLAAMSIP